MATPFDASIATGRTRLGLKIPDVGSEPGGWLPAASIPAGPGGAALAGGMGDVRATARIGLAEGEAGAIPWLDLALQTRLPSATDPRLGAGQWEHVLRVETGMAFEGAVAIDASLGRRIAPFGRRGRGEKDYWVAEASLAMPLAPSWTVGLAAYAQDRQPDIATPVMELGTFIERDLGEDLSVGLFTWHGLTRESPAFTIGLRLAYRLRWSPARLGP